MNTSNGVTHPTRVCLRNIWNDLDPAIPSIFTITAGVDNHRWTLGRENADILLRESEKQKLMISRQHAQIVFEPCDTLTHEWRSAMSRSSSNLGPGQRSDCTLCRWRLIDLGSLNGLFVNDVKLSETPLYHGDIILFGSGYALPVGERKRHAISEFTYRFEVPSIVASLTRARPSLPPQTIRRPVTISPPAPQENGDMKERREENEAPVVPSPPAAAAAAPATPATPAAASHSSTPSSSSSIAGSKRKFSAEQESKVDDLAPPTPTNAISSPSSVSSQSSPATTATPAVSINRNPSTESSKRARVEETPEINEVAPQASAVQSAEIDETAPAAAASAAAVVDANHKSTPMTDDDEPVATPAAAPAVTTVSTSKVDADKPAVDTSSPIVVDSAVPSSPVTPPSASSPVAPASAPTPAAAAPESDTLDALIADNSCSICHNLLILPDTLPCSHRFCSTCLTDWFMGRHTTCPNCTCEVDFNYSYKPSDVEGQIDDPIIASLVARTLTDAEKKQRTQTFADLHKNQARQAKRDKQLTEYMDKARAAGKTVLDVTKAWKESEINTFRVGISSYTFRGRLEYCNLVGLTPAILQSIDVWATLQHIVKNFSIPLPGSLQATLSTVLPVLELCSFKNVVGAFSRDQLDAFEDTKRIIYLFMCFGVKKE